MRFIPQSVMTGFVNALGILIFFAQVPHFWSRSPLIVGLFVLTLLIVLWVPRYIKASLSADCHCGLNPVHRDHRQILPTVGDEGSMSGLPGLTQLLVPLNLDTLSIIWPCALSIAFVGLLESLLTAKLVDELTVTPSVNAAKALAWASAISGRSLRGHCRLRDDRANHRQRGDGQRPKPHFNPCGRHCAAAAGDALSDVMAKSRWRCWPDYGDCRRQNLQLAQHSPATVKGRPWRKRWSCW
jgi:hypothetical protein